MERFPQEASRNQSKRDQDMRKIIYRVEMFFHESDPFTEDQEREMEREIRKAFEDHDRKLGLKSTRFRLANIGYPRVRPTQEIVTEE
jgi:hypothetical protein